MMIESFSLGSKTIHYQKRKKGGIEENLEVNQKVKIVNNNKKNKRSNKTCPKSILKV